MLNGITIIYSIACIGVMWELLLFVVCKVENSNVTWLDRRLEHSRQLSAARLTAKSFIHFAIPAHSTTPITMC